MRTLLLSLAMLALTASTALAQSDERRRGSRGEDRGDRRERGERESRGGEGGFRGGPPGGFPGGGFPGGGFGGPPGGGFPGGGFPGGGRGGFRGGDRDDERGGRGGFNPEDMIRRFDRNNNNMIDPDEAQGPAQFFLQRMAQNNPKIDLSKPVPIDLLTGEMERMRGGGDDSDEEMSNEPALLVPDFSLSATPAPVAGFGASSARFAVKIQDRDLKEAEERLRRYDRDRDGSLSAEEVRRGRWPDDPMQFDRNRDGKLTASELAVRYANQRIEEEAERNDPNNRNNDSGNRGWGGNNNGWVRSDPNEESAKEEESRFGDAKSYRLTPREERVNSIKGLPDFFARSDADGDGQVLMNEFSSSWNAETLADFMKWDLNNDGIITVRECVAVGATNPESSSARSPDKGSATASATASPAGSTSSPGSARSQGSTGNVDIEWAARQIAKYDTNNDKQLTAAEWEAMIIKPTGADSNGDGILTIEEYAQFRAKK